VIKLVKATQAISEGDIRQVNLRKGFTGELKVLAEALSQMIVALNRKSSVPDSHISELTRQKGLLTDAAASVIRARLEKIDKKLESADSDAAVEIKGLVAIMEDINQLVRFFDGAAKSSKSDADICGMLSVVEDSCRSLIHGREIELIIECDESLAKRRIPVDAKVLKRVAASLLRNAIRTTEIGTVTLLPSIVGKDNREFLEIAVSDTGSEQEPKAIALALDKGVFFSPYLELVIARELTELLGGRISFDSTEGKGSLITLLVPLGEASADVPEEVVD
jgi:signal transduction histidine kinase